MSNGTDGKEASAPTPSAPAPKGEKQKMVAGILGILLGALGIHKFYLGYTKEGVIMLVVTLVVGGITCGVGASAVSIVASLSAR